MTMTEFPNDKSVKVTKTEFASLILALNETIKNHIQYVEDEVTQTTWKDLECNGISKKELLTVTGVAHMIDMTDTSQMTLARVISNLFTLVPVLKHYWMITKLNTQSLYIERKSNVNISTLFDKLKRTSAASTPVTKPRAKVQTTLTQMRNDDGSVTEAKQKEDEDQDGFQTPKKTVLVTNVQVTSNKKDSNNNNSYSLLSEESNTDDDYVQDDETATIQIEPTVLVMDKPTKGSNSESVKESNNSVDKDEDLSYSDKSHNITVTGTAQPSAKKCLMLRTQYWFQFK